MTESAHQATDPAARLVTQIVNRTAHIMHKRRQAAVILLQRQAVLPARSYPCSCRMLRLLLFAVKT